MQIFLMMYQKVKAAASYATITHILRRNGLKIQMVSGFLLVEDGDDNKIINKSSDGDRRQL